MTIRRAFKNVLKKLAERPNEYINARCLPNGHGHTHPHGARGDTLSEMKSMGLIEYGRPISHSLNGWKITKHGLSVLQAEAALTLKEPA